MSRSQLLVLLVIVVIILALALAAILSLRSAHRAKTENARLADLVRSHEERQSRLAAGETPRPDPVVTPLQKEAGVSPVAPAPRTDEELMAWIDSRMDESRLFLRTDLNLKTLARELGLTQKRIAEVLKSQDRYGSLPEYLIHKRLMYACQLLRRKPYFSIDSVAKDSGFRARKTFQTLFKARIGMTPSQYREHSALRHGKEPESR